MYDYLLELICEEIPASMQKAGGEAIKDKICAMFEEQRISFKAATIYYTPRRFCLDIRGLAEYSQDNISTRKGPSVSAPKAALEGFMRSCGLASLDEADIVEDPKKGAYYVANIVQKGLSIFEIIEKHMPLALKQVSWKKSMRWSTISDVSWVRPIRNIMSVLYSETEGSKIAPFEFAGLQANNYSFGHRFLSKNKQFFVKNFDDYASQLQANYVVLDAARRKMLIKDAAENIALANGLQLVEDEALLAEMAGLVEYPIILLGSFDEIFLKLPWRVIQTTIKENQKCLVTRDLSSLELANKFVICANIQASDGGALIVKGNEKVVRARLEDALYFYNKDLKQPLVKFAETLSAQNISAYSALGTQSDKINRLKAIGLYLANKFAYSNVANVERAAMLAKADLATDMVMEFPNLQGYIGHCYGLQQGENSEVAKAIEEHYKPQSVHDTVPKNLLSIILSLADKIDMIAGFWSVGEKPSGSRDPFALRRSALAIVRLLLAQEKYICLYELIEKALSHFKAETEARDLYCFIEERFKNYVREEGARYDVVDAIMEVSSTDLLYKARMIEALILYLDSVEGQNFAQAIKRVNNFSAECKVEANFAPALETSPQALALYNKVLDIENRADEHYIKDFSLLSELSSYISEFFDHVMVNDEDRGIRNNRLALLKMLEQTAKKFADFSKIVIA